MAKELIAKIISANMKDAVVVSIEKKYRHPKYHKVLIRHKRLKARCNLKNIKVNDMVKVVETRPLSKHISFLVVDKFEAKA